MPLVTAVSNAVAVVYPIAVNREPTSPLDAIAEQIGVSKYYLSSWFRAEKGVGFTEYVQKLKIRCAMGLLRSSSESMDEIATECGFSSASYFSQVFRSLVDDA